jgi:riboflavin kinase/FMN adenylyltransferase
LKIFDQSVHEIPQCERGVALGFFDGVHRGHTDLIRTLTANCYKMKLEPAVFTFNEHPDTIAHRQKRFSGYLTTFSERIELLAELGVGEIHCRHFDDAFCHLSPQDFLDDFIAAHLNARLLVVGSDYRFGYRGEGNVEFLRQWCKRKNVRLLVVPDVRLYDERISSTRIRKLVEKGDMKLAASCLGRPFAISGTVVKGRKIGRAMGFPTANFILAPEQVSPAYGVYVSRTRVDNETYWSITNFGLRPTVNTSDMVPIAETYIFDAKLDLYDKMIEVHLLQMMRPELKFNSLLKLGTQIKDDLDQARAWHQSCEDAYIATCRKSVPVWLLQTERFAQASLQLVFQRRMDRSKSTALALLLQVLTASCRRFPGRVLFSTELDRLYGASIDCHIEKHGDLQTLYLMADALVSWSDGSRPFDEVINLLFDVLLDPQLDDDGLFDQAIFESEKQNMITEWLSRENDRARYAYDRSIELLCGDQAHGLRPGGELEVLKALTRSDLNIVYKELLENTALMVCIGGKISESSMLLLKERLAGIPESSDRPVFGIQKPSFLEDPSEQVVFDEFKSIEQARLGLIMTGLPPYFSHQGIVVSMLNSMLGGDVHSLLFDTVREKMGLAYSVFSSYSRYLSAILILAGVEPSKTGQAIESIREQVSNLTEGHFDERLIEASREMLSGSIKAANDDLGHMISTVVNSITLGRSLSCEDALSLLSAVSREDIMKMAANLKPVVQFRLLPETGKEAAQ